MKATKKPLVNSVFSLAVCIAMLIGTTYAWFTDSAMSGRNKVVAGNLDVAMYYADGTQDPAAVIWTKVENNAIFRYGLWEPGYVEVKHIKVANVGTLALKYQLEIAVDGELSDLAKVLDVYASVGEAVPAATREDLADTSKFVKLGTVEQLLTHPEELDLAGNLMPAGTEGKTNATTLTVGVKMQETAGNEYQGLSIGNGFTVAVKATQYTEENDSFDSRYDENAD